MKKLVVIESPYAGDVDANLAYLRRCLRDSLLVHDECPFASHGLYTQPGVLDDLDTYERMLGIDAGFRWGRQASLRAFYVDRGVSKGMRLGYQEAARLGQPTEIRTLDRNLCDAEIQELRALLQE